MDHSEKVKQVALSIMNQASTCALITVDSEGITYPRMMQTLPTEDDFVVWLATNPKTRKAAQIIENSKVSLYYIIENSDGYVSIQGKAELVNSKDAKEKYWKEGWEAFYQDKEKDMILIKIVPETMEIVSYQNGITSTEENWAAEKIVFKK